MGLDVLRCKTPEMVRKEVLVGVLMYNLIRQTILQAAQEDDVSPRHLSFTAALITCFIIFHHKGTKKEEKWNRDPG